MTTKANTDDEPDVTEDESTAAEVTSGADESDSKATEAEAATAEDAETKADAPTSRTSGVGNVLGFVRRWLAAIIVAILFLASAGVAAGLYYFQYRPDQQLAQEAGAAMDAAKNGSIALLSYSPETLDKDFANAKNNLTGDFLNYYTQFTQQIVTPAAKQKQVKTAAQVVQAGMQEIHQNSATVLLFINQVTTSKENPDGAFAASAVRVGLQKIDGRWLINAFDPV